ncbi:hypothetical protein FKW77_000165 [Venturia effusa]|uniref:Uncharacterized protein n=1 Tax=Venturia effusa TaxID=50376 RepID=A0A517LPB6_9PEZI|nr:hypothetical protein FKW77_000165 [Venturia effusa]
MKELAPSYITENWRLLQEKLTDTVLERGLLVSHPGDEFDLLEERVLETLDLCPPRITACGHYYGIDSDSDSGNDSGIADLSETSKPAREICSALVEEEDICQQCEQHMRLPRKGIGAGSRKWDVKIFAANGLMKASAWAAACLDMERVDVEIEPWMPDDVKRALDARLIEEDEEKRRHVDYVELLKLELREMEKARYEAEAARLRAEERVKAAEMMRLEAEAARLQADKLAQQRQAMQLKAAVAESQALELLSKVGVSRVEADAAKLRAEQTVQEMDEQLRRAFDAKTISTAGLETADATQRPAASAASSSIPDRLLTLGCTSSPGEQQRLQVPSTDIPLSTLLYNYLYILTQDRQNLVLGFLSSLIVILSYHLVVPQAAGYATPNALCSQNSYVSSAQISAPSVDVILTPCPTALMSKLTPESRAISNQSLTHETRERRSASTTPPIPSSVPASTPGSQDIALGQQPAKNLESKSSPPSTYSLPAFTGPRIPLVESEPEKKGDTQKQTSPNSHRLEPVLAGETKSTATTSRTTPWTECIQAFTTQSCIA